MVDPKNNGTYVGNLVKDPEIRNNNVAIFTIAMNYAAEDNTDNPSNTGFFDVTYYLDESKASTFIRSRIEDKKMKKGSNVIITGAICQKRWKGQDGKTQYGFKIRATNLGYVGSANTEGAAEGGNNAAAAVNDVPTDF